MSKENEVKIEKINSWKKISRSMIVINQDTEDERHLIFNEVGMFIWNSITSGRSPIYIVDKIVKDYSIQKDRAIQDVESFLGKLENEKIITCK